MRVLLIDALCNEGSTGRIAYEITKSLQVEGNVALLCYALSSKEDELLAYKFALNFETYVHALLSRVTGFFCRYSPISTWRLIKRIEKFKPDIVNIHDAKPYYFNLKALLNYLNNNKIKTVLSLHSEFFYTGKCGHSYDCTRWKKNCGSCPQLSRYPRSLFIDRTKEMLAEKKSGFELLLHLEVVCPSKWMADRASQSLLSNRQIHVINNGIDTKIFKPAPCGDLRQKYRLENKKIVLSVAPQIMSELKGGLHVVELATQMRGENTMFILIGAETQECKSHDNIIILPTVYDRKELAAFYSMADVFLLCSKRESFSLTCAEALCCGTRIIGYKCGAPETIFSGEYCNFVEYGDCVEMERMIRKTIKADWTEIDRLKCSTESATRYGVKAMTEEYLELYTKMYSRDGVQKSKGK